MNTLINDFEETNIGLRKKLFPNFDIYVQLFGHFCIEMFHGNLYFCNRNIGALYAAKTYAIIVSF